MRILLLVSAFNGLSQRIWDELRTREHNVTVALALTESAIVDAVHSAQPELILCPFLKDRVPAEIWRKWPTVIIHPGPVGDQGPSSLDWAITEGAPEWGVTALSAVEEMDAGPIWATRTFPLPADAPRKSTLYGGPVTQAAVECALAVVEHAADPEFRPVDLADAPRPIADARLRPLMKQVDRAFDWAADAADIVRRVRAADGYPGVRTTLLDTEVNAFDAHPGSGKGRPGEVIGRRGGYLLVAAGTGAVWLGQLKLPGGVKLPATTVLPADVPLLPDGPREISYQRRGPVGTLSFSFYNGAHGTEQSLRLRSALRHAASQDTRVLILRGGHDVFSNGIHLGEIEAATDPAATAWASIRAINGACRALIEATDQLTIAAYTGNAGAGGVMLALGADVVTARAGVVLNPYYDMGLFGSELHTATLPRRVGKRQAATYLEAKLPVGADSAALQGLIDLVGPAEPAAFDQWLTELADRYAEPGAWRRTIDSRQPFDRPLDYYEQTELAEMARDMFDDRNGFATARGAFVHKRRPEATPARLTGRA